MINFGNPYAGDFSVETVLQAKADLMLLDVGNLFKAQETGLIEKMPRKFATGAGKVRPVVGMLGNDVAHPHLRAEHQGQKNHGYKCVNHVYSLI
ncbi:MAG: hypothetical protein AAGA00_11865, partial [Pseudomonadota bacterium]